MSGRAGSGGGLVAVTVFLLWLSQCSQNERISRLERAVLPDSTIPTPDSIRTGTQTQEEG